MRTNVHYDKKDLPLTVNEILNFLGSCPKTAVITVEGLNITDIEFDNDTYTVNIHPAKGGNQRGENPESYA